MHILSQTAGLVGAFIQTSTLSSKQARPCKALVWSTLPTDFAFPITEYESEPCLVTVLRSPPGDKEVGLVIGRPSVARKN